MDRHANTVRLYAICSHMWHVDQVLPALEALELHHLQPFMTQLLGTCHLECLLHGNFTRPEALQLAESVAQSLGQACSMPGNGGD